MQIYGKHYNALTVSGTYFRPCFGTESDEMEAFVQKQTWGEGGGSDVDEKLSFENEQHIYLSIKC